MHYKKFQPHKKLHDFLECYFIWEGSAEKPNEIESPPSSLCSLVFNYGDPYQISNHKYEKYTVPDAFVSGQAIKNYTLHLNGKINVVGAVLKPVALFNFFNEPMFNLTGERVHFSIMAPNSAEALYQEIERSNSDSDKIKILEAYFLELLDSNQHASKDMIAAANGIYEQRGQISIQDVLDSVPMSRRNFERRFLHEVGVSPKAYAKIRRFGYTCLLMAGKRDIDLMDVLHEGGYYDQSHFIKDFKYFSGRTPRTYVKLNRELANYVDQITMVERRLQSEK